MAQNTLLELLTKSVLNEADLKQIIFPLGARIIQGTSALFPPFLLGRSMTFFWRRSTASVSNKSRLYDDPLNISLSSIFFIFLSVQFIYRNEFFKPSSNAFYSSLKGVTIFIKLSSKYVYCKCQEKIQQTKMSVLKIQIRYLLKNDLAAVQKFSHIYYSMKKSAHLSFCRTDGLFLCTKTNLIRR